jgi:hypothetical protein
MLDAGETQIESLERVGPDMHEGEVVERAKPKFEPLGLEFGGTSGKRSHNRGRYA